MALILNGTGVVTGLASINDGTVVPADLSTGGPYWDTSGNLGIGTTSPSEELHVVGGNIKTDFSSRQIGYWETSGLFDGYFVPYDNSGFVQIVSSFSSGGVLFKTGNSKTERARIDSSGNVLVGTTRNDYGTLSVVNNSSTFATNQAYAYFKGSQAGDVSSPGLFIVKFDNNTTTSQLLIRFGINNGASGQGQINANGGGAAAFGSYSDARLKENIESLPPQLNKILALKPSEFDYKDGTGHQIGFIAQEMQEVYPDVVSVGENDMLTITGWSKTEARLVKAIQEQQAIIETLVARIEALENK